MIEKLALVRYKSHNHLKSREASFVYAGLLSKRRPRLSVSLVSSFIVCSLRLFSNLLIPGICLEDPERLFPGSETPEMHFLAFSLEGIV